jgi:5'-nucleotidase (lipoprotein e(P4) family)
MATVTTQEQLNDQLVLSVNWTQESGEYAAVTYQAFNLAKRAFDQALASGVKNPAVSVDLDETLIDNSAYEAGLIDTNNQFSNSTWYPWIKSENATAIPGAVDFVNYVNSKGGKVFFISDRDESSTGSSANNDLEQSTINNLVKLGFSDVNDQTVLLRGEFTATKADGTVDRGKELRRQAVTNGNADGNQYELVLLAGDNLNDFDNKAGTANADRRAYVEANQNQYGVYQPGKAAYIPLPNAQYGAWEGPGLYNPAAFDKTSWTQLTPAEKNIQRKQNLDVWKPAVPIATPSGGSQDRLNEQLVLPINWTQESGEFDATAYSAYIAAKLAFDDALASGVSNPSVVLDLDETVLDNSAYEAWLVGTDNQFSNSTWYQWIQSREATAVAGSVEFINYVNAQGGKAFFISDRDESSMGSSVDNDLEQATIENLLKLGVTGANEDTVLLRGEFVGINPDGSPDRGKELRRQAVENGNADGINYNTVVLVGDNLNDFDNKAGTTNAQRRAYVDANQNRYGIYEPGKPAYIPLSNPQYGAWEGPGLYDPAAFDKAQWFQLEPAEKNLQRKQALTRWTVESDQPFTGVPATLSGSGGTKIFAFTRGDSLGLVVNFDGVRNNGAVADLTQADALQFTGEGLTAENLLLTQKGADLFVNFDGIPDTQVILKNTKLDSLDNFGASGNFLFDGETSFQDDYDVFGADFTNGAVLNSNTVSFFNERDNSITGLDNSADVINAEGGNDSVAGLGGDDLLRGGNGDYTLVGGDGVDKLTGGSSSDTFGYAGNVFANGIPAPAGTTDIKVLNQPDIITDYDIKQDRFAFNGKDLDIDKLEFQKFNSAELEDGTALVLLNPFPAAAAAARAIADNDKVKADAGVFVYFNTTLGIARLVYSKDLGDGGDISVLANLANQTSASSLADLTNNNFSLLTQ